MTHLHNGVSPCIAALRMCLATAALGLAGSASAADTTTRMIVAFKDGSAEQVKAAVHAARGKIVHQILDTNAIAVDMPGTALVGLRRNQHIDYIEPDVKRYPLSLSMPSSDPYLAGQQVPYGIPMVQADLLPDTNTANRMVCIIDSGYDMAHEDLSGNQVTGEYDKDDNGAGTGWWYLDDNGHGTHVAGTIAAINNSGTGVVGVASNQRIKLHIVKVFSAEGWAYSSTLASAARLCGKAGANVISMSLGGGSPSRLERQAFKYLADKGVLSIAAAGNDGNSALSFPAAYRSVMMVGALDQNKQWAPFSQFNYKVEISAPGVDVLSTVPMNSGSEAALSIGASAYTVWAMNGSPKVSATAELADFGLGDVPDPAMAGKVCLIQRGAITFGTKVSNCEASGGLGAIVYNNAPEAFSGTLGTTVTSIPSVSASGDDGALMSAQLGQSAAITITPLSYAYFSGTSMATPHVAGVAALVWSYFPGCNGKQIRSTLGKSAQDLGSFGRDVRYGYGLVQAKAAYERIATRGCGH